MRNRVGAHAGIFPAAGLARQRPPLAAPRPTPPHAFTHAAPRSTTRPAAHAAPPKDADAAPRIGLAIAGGGPIGGMYEPGALRALEDAIEGLDLTRMDCYVGVSSGAFLAAGLANRMSAGEMCRIFITGDSDDVRFRPETFLRPAMFEYLRRAASLPRLTLEWWRGLLLGPRDARWSDLLNRFGGLVPTGLFDNAADRGLPARDLHPARAQQRFPRTRPAAVRGRGGPRQRRGGALRRRGLGRRADLARCRPAPRCPGCIRRSTCAGASSSTARCAGPCTPRCCSNAASTCCSASTRWCRSTTTTAASAPANATASPRAACRRCCRRPSAPCCSRGCRWGWRATCSSTPTSTSWCSNRTKPTATCSSPTPSASPRAAASASWATATRSTTCATAARRWRRCWPRTGCRCARRCSTTNAAPCSAGCRRAAAQHRNHRAPSPRAGRRRTPRRAPQAIARRVV